MVTIFIHEACGNTANHLQIIYMYCDNFLYNIKFFLIQLTEISKISDLTPLATCPKLTRLDLRGNPVTKTADIQMELAELLPSLTDIFLW